MKIYQTQIRYLQEEDRLLFSVLTTEHQELRFLLTRRLVMLAMPILIDALKKSSSVVLQPSNEGKEVKHQLEHERALSEFNFNQPYSTNIRERPLGDEALLIHTLKLKAFKQGYQLSLHDKQGKGVEMRVDEKLIHSLVKLIYNVALNADWRIEQTRLVAHSAQLNEAIH